MNTLNSVILAMQSQEVFSNRQAMCVEVKASFLSRFLQKKGMKRLTKVKMKTKKGLEKTYKIFSA